MNPLLTFIENQLKLGVTRDVITNQLIGQGWKRFDIDQAFISLEVPPAQASTSPIPTPSMTSVPISTASPIPQTQPVYNAIPQNQPQPKKSKLLLTLVIFVVALCVVGGGAFAYYKFFMPGLSPTDILKKSFDATLNVRSFSFTATSTGQVEDQLGNGIPSSSDFTFNSSGSIDFHVPSAPLFAIDLGINANSNTTSYTGSLSSDIGTIFINKSVYLDLKNFKVSYTSSDPKAAQAQSFVSLANIVAALFENKWIQFDESGAISAGTQNPQSLSTEDVTAVKNYVSGMSYIKAISNAGDENINDISTYHLKMTVQGNQALVDLIQKIATDQGKTMTPDQVQNLSQTLTTQKIDIDIWIGKADFLVYKIVTLPVSISSPVTVGNSQSSVKMTMSQEISFSDYNQPVSVTAPQGAIPMQQVLQGLMGGLNSGATTKSAVIPAKAVNPVTTTVKPAVQHIPVLTWQSSPYSNRLCFTSNVSSCLGTVGKGLIDLHGDGSIMLGATEYCQYLDANGSTLDKTPQNIWRLPTYNEWKSIGQGTASTLIKYTSDQGLYWSSTISSNRPDYYDDIVPGSFSSYDGPSTPQYTLCVRYL